MTAAAVEDHGPPPPPPEEIRIEPQRPFQWDFLGNPADIVIGGGAAGCGKTYAEVLAPIRFTSIPNFYSVMFRRTLVDIKKPNGLWDETRKMYPLLGAKPHGAELRWQFPSGARVKMAHLEHENTVTNWQGAQLPQVIFDELTHFSAKMFWYMVSRLRGTVGVRPHVLASCNPDPDSWVAALIEWFIDQEDVLPGGERNPRYGFPIPERCGKPRYFGRSGDDLVWGDTRLEVANDPRIGPQIIALMRHQRCTWEVALKRAVKSLSFIPGKLEDNRILEDADPSYRANLMILPRVERMRLLEGNWKVRAQAGDYFNRDEVNMLDRAPDDLQKVVRRWDLAATEPSLKNGDPDWTYGVKMGRRANGRFVVLDAVGKQQRVDAVRELVLGTAAVDTQNGEHVEIGLPQDPGQAGVDQLASYVKMLAGYAVWGDRETGDKETRASSFAAQWQHHNVDVVRGSWNAHYFGQMEAFPDKTAHDDAVDASAGAFKQLATGTSMYDVVYG